jgi:hypothetical protein
MADFNQITFLVFLLLFHYCHSYELIDKFSGVVEGGEASYFTLKQSSIILICLISDNGDADLYVDYSSITDKPNYESHSFSAASTGLDVVTVLPSEGAYVTLSIAIHGHINHKKSSYRLYILSPSESDVKEFQIWEYNYFSKTNTLVIDVDPLWMSNDPKLHRMLEVLTDGDVYIKHSSKKGSLTWEDYKDWIVWFFVNSLRIIVEILA